MPLDMNERVIAPTEKHTLAVWPWLRERADAVGRAWLRIGLPAKLLLLTAVFVMLAEILIFLPSIANYRIGWLNDRLTAANVAALAAEAVPGRTVPPALRNELVRTALVRAVAIRRGGARRLILPPVSELSIDEHFDLRQPPGLTPLTIDPSGTWFRPEGRFYIGGTTPAEGNDPGGAPLEVQHQEWDEMVWPVLAGRVPAFEAAKVVSAGFVFCFNFGTRKLLLFTRY